MMIWELPTTDNANEEQARLVGMNRAKLISRLEEARSVLIPSLYKRFKDAQFSFKLKRLIGDGCYLQWQTRRWPDKPVSYENQQNTSGFVAFRVKE